VKSIKKGSKNDEIDSVYGARVKSSKQADLRVHKRVCVKKDEKTATL